MCLFGDFKFDPIDSYFSLVDFMFYIPLKVIKGNTTVYEPCHKKTGFLPMRKQRRRSASQLLRS